MIKLATHRPIVCISACRAASADTRAVAEFRLTRACVGKYPRTTMKSVANAARRACGVGGVRGVRTRCATTAAATHLAPATRLASYRVPASAAGSTRPVSTLSLRTGPPVRSSSCTHVRAGLPRFHARRHLATAVTRPCASSILDSDGSEDEEEARELVSELRTVYNELASLAGRPQEFDQVTGFSKQADLLFEVMRQLVTLPQLVFPVSSQAGEDGEPRLFAAQGEEGDVVLHANSSREECLKFIDAVGGSLGDRKVCWQPPSLPDCGNATAHVSMLPAGVSWCPWWLRVLH